MKAPVLQDRELTLVFADKHQDSDPNGWGLSYIYDIVVEDRVVGRCDLRLGSTWVLDLAGHIGYTVYLPYRGHGYARRSSELLFKQAVYLGVKELLITCNTDNLASYRTIEKTGAELIKVVEVPKEHPLYWQGDREKAVFLKRLKD